MVYIIIPLVAAFASLLTFFSGFGLGTLLTPAFAIFFPIELAVGLTAIVHFLNGLLKLSLVGRYASKEVILRFGVPAIFAALLGAWVLSQISNMPPLLRYELFEHEFLILPIKLIMAALILFFTIFELLPKLRDLEVSKKYLSAGGLISGFFGGLSGHQGALRSAFLARSGLSKEQYLGTGAVIASMIDVARISVYSRTVSSEILTNNLPLLSISTFSAFVGAYIGNKLLKKTTMESVQTIVSISLFLLAITMAAGII